MARNGDYIPTRDAEFNEWFFNYQDYVLRKSTGSNPAWTHIPATKITALLSCHTAWENAYADMRRPHTSVETKAKNDARKAAKTFIRDFTNQYLRFDPVTDEDRLAMGIHNKDPVRTTTGVPTTRPVLSELKALGGARVEVRVHDEDSPDSRAIPYGYNGCVLYYAWGPAAIGERKLLTHTKLATRFPYILDLPIEASGSTLSLTACWQNRDLLGKPSGIESVLVS